MDPPLVVPFNALTDDVDHERGTSKDTYLVDVGIFEPDDESEDASVNHPGDERVESPETFYPSSSGSQTNKSLLVVEYLSREGG